MPAPKKSKADLDRVQPFFERDQFRDPEVVTAETIDIQIGSVS